MNTNYFFYIVVSKRFDVKLALTNSAISRIIAKLGSAENPFTVTRSSLKKIQKYILSDQQTAFHDAGSTFFSLACTAQMLQYTIFGRLTSRIATFLEFEFFFDCLRLIFGDDLFKKTAGKVRVFRVMS